MPKYLLKMSLVLHFKLLVKQQELGNTAEGLAKGKLVLGGKTERNRSRRRRKSRKSRKSRT